jgi:glycine/D-amino acid oxidase-like deaminating enzyme
VLYGRVFDNADYEGVDKVLINKTSGWGQAKDALQAGTRHVINLGVTYITAEVDRLEFGDQRRCVGIRTQEGVTISADQTILCTGAFTPVLLEEAADSTSCHAFRPEGRMIAASAATALVNPDKEMMETLRDKPMFLQDSPAHGGVSVLLRSSGYICSHVTGLITGTFPPHAEDQIKFYGESICQFPQGSPPISRPPLAVDYNQWEVPKALKADFITTVGAAFGERGGTWEIHTHRLCW